ncbi:phosphotransferase [Phototrophicus methaneseepsis]|uniref:Phosphotransferase n=1 Tax=Phototrophicus methaneseepsis TaxID=2710758 RepID=A0A7S8ED80_9CHLR|nr:phosphotransferase [Phototrophicus methaneseepsis]QPC84827.1 phosphotransferase [Phototrophicus methaneseepsis]
MFTNSNDITPERMTLVFKEHGILPTGNVTMARVLKASESAENERFSLLIHYDDVRVISSAPRQVFMKISKPSFEWGEKEVRFYNEIAPRMFKRYRAQDFPVLQCYAAEYFPELGRSFVILEDISDRFKPAHDGAPPSLLHYEKIMEGLAHLHAYWWEHEDLGNHTPLPDAAMLDEQLTAYQAKYEAFKAHMLKIGRLGVRQQQILETVTTKWPSDQRERLLAGKGITLIHRDTHPDNFMYAPREVKLLDWQSWRAGVGTTDIAYFLAGFAPDNVRKFQEKRLVQRYYDTLLRLGVKNYSWQACWDDYRMSVGYCIAFLLNAWQPAWVQSGRWTIAERAMKVFDELDVMALYA